MHTRTARTCTTGTIPSGTSPAVPRRKDRKKRLELRTHHDMGLAGKVGKHVEQAQVPGSARTSKAVAGSSGLTGHSAEGRLSCQLDKNSQIRREVSDQ